MRTAKPMPEMAKINESLQYNVDGTFSWKIRPRHHFPTNRAHSIWNARYGGKPCFGGKSKNGYVYLTLDNKSLSAHRLVWFIHHKEIDPNKEIDHLNGVRHDNRIENLRIAFANGNQHNKPKQKNNTSGYKNVVWNRQCNKWQVVVTLKKKAYHFGLFDDVHQAGLMAIDARKKLHADFANHGSFVIGEDGRRETPASDVLSGI